MRIFFYTLCMACMLLFSADGQCIVALHPHLPTEQTVPGWKLDGPQIRYVPDSLFNYINGGAEIFNEFGFQELTVQTYRKGDLEITVELYRMDGSPAALGMFYQQGGQNQGKPHDSLHIARSPYQWTLQKGAWFIQLNSPANTRGVERDMTVFAELITAQISAEPIDPFNLLPEENRITGSEFLVRGQYGMEPVFTFGDGDVLQLCGRHFAVGAEYSNVDDHRFTKLIISYEDVVAAERVFRSLDSKLDSTLQILDKSGERIVFRDFKKKFGYIRLAGNRLEIDVNLSRQPD